MHENKLLKGSGIEVDFLKIYPLTLGEVTELGEEEYQRILGLFFIDIDELGLKKTPELAELSNFIIFSLILQQEPEIREQIRLGLELFTKQEITFQNGVFYFNNEVPILEDSWDKIREIVALQNKIDFKKKEEYNPVGDKAKAFMKKRQEVLDKVKEIRSKKNDKIDFVTLVSSLSAKHPSINLLNVWDLTYYQFYDQLERLQLIQEYEISIQSLLAGADSKKVKLKHWITKI